MIQDDKISQVNLFHAPPRGQGGGVVYGCPRSLKARPSLHAGAVKRAIARSASGLKILSFSKYYRTSCSARVL